MGLKLGPSLLPAAEQGRSRMDRRMSSGAATAAPQLPRAIVPRTSARIAEVHLHGASAGLPPDQLRSEVSRALQSGFSTEKGRASRQSLPVLRSGADAREVARHIADAIVRQTRLMGEEIE